MNETRPPNTDLSTNTQYIRSYVEGLVDAGRHVIAIMHSYGGQVGTNALIGLGLSEKRTQQRFGPREDSTGGRGGGGVVHLIYMCAFALPEGDSMIGKVREFNHEHLMELAFDFAEDKSCLARDPETILIGAEYDNNEEAEAEVREYLDTLVRWNGRCTYQEISQSAWREIPVTYILTTRDFTVPVDYQKYASLNNLCCKNRRAKTIIYAWCFSSYMLKG